MTEKTLKTAHETLCYVAAALEKKHASTTAARLVEAANEIETELDSSYPGWGHLDSEKEGAGEGDD